MNDLIISREAVFKILCANCTHESIEECEVCKTVAEILDLPSADRPSGHWVLVNRGLDIYMCDQCGEILQIDRLPIWDYCPMCGARMGGETDGRPNKQTGGY